MVKRTRRINVERWDMIRQFQRLICSGYSPNDAAGQVNRERQAAGKPELSRDSVWRFIRRARQGMARVAAQPEPEARAEAIQSRLLLKQLALERTKSFVVGDALTTVPDPDLNAYANACKAMEEIHGLTEQNRLEMLRLVLDSYTRDVMEFLREEISNQAELVRVLTRMRALAVVSARALEKGRIVHRDTIPMLAAEAVVIEAKQNGQENANGKEKP